MVAFWRDHPSAPPAGRDGTTLGQLRRAGTEQSQPQPDGAGMGVEDYFNARIHEIESSPAAYAGFRR
jgi:hypothetical protein